MNIATDLALLIMPMPLLSQLQLPRTQKFALVGVFAIGGLYVLSLGRLQNTILMVSSVVITSALRLSSLHEVAKAPDTSCKPLFFF